MSQRQWLNASHRDYCERMKRAATKRSAQPPMSPAEFARQVRRLRLRRHPLRSAS